MDDYIGGRYSSTSCVGGVVLSLAFGPEVFARFLDGAAQADALAKEPDPMKNPAMLDALIGVYERNVLGYPDANSREMSADTPHNVIDIMPDQKGIPQLGGTMRLGAYQCRLTPGSKAWEAYSGQDIVSGRHRHRYELNPTYAAELAEGGMICTGRNPQTGLAEIVEVPSHPWYVGTQFLPEYTSTVMHPHPLFAAFIHACIENTRP